MMMMRRGKMMRMMMMMMMMMIIIKFRTSNLTFGDGLFFSNFKCE